MPRQQHLYLCSFYRPPGTGAEPFQELEKAITAIDPKGEKHIIIAGDLNCGHIDWSTTNITENPSERGAHEELLTLLDNHSLTNTQHEPTRESRNLDLHLTSRPSLVKTQSVIPGVSDHEIIVVDSDIKPTYNPTPPRKVFSFNSAKADWPAVRTDISAFVENYLTTHTSRGVDENWELIREELHKALDKHIPSRTKTTRYNLPWMNRELKRLIRKKQRSYNKARKSKNTKSEEWNAYRALKKNRPPKAQRSA